MKCAVEAIIDNNVDILLSVVDAEIPRAFVVSGEWGFWTEVLKDENNGCYINFRRTRYYLKVDGTPKVFKIDVEKTVAYNKAH